MPNSYAYEEIRMACSLNDLEGFNRLCSSNPPEKVSQALKGYKYVEPNYRSSTDSKSCMHISVEENNLQMIELIAQIGGGVDNFDLMGWTPLFYAIREKDKRDIRVIRKLLELGADPKKSVPREDYAKLSDSLARNPLEKALKYGDFEVVDLLLAYGVDANMQNAGRYIVHFCALLQSVDSFKGMVARGADPHTLDCLGRTALHLAFDSYHVNASPMALYLINEVCIDVSIKDQEGHTALCYSMKVPFKEVAEAFIKKGAVVEKDIRLFARQTSIDYEGTCEALGIYS